MVSLRRVAPNTSEQRSRSGLCEGVIRREATETEGLVTYINLASTYLYSSLLSMCVVVCVCLFVCPDCIKRNGGIKSAFIIEIKTNFQMLF